MLMTVALALPGPAGAAGSPRPAPPAPAPPAPEPPRPFGQGAINVGLAMGLSTGGGTAFTLGGAFGYFVLPGLEPGLQLDVTFGSGRPTVTALLPYLRWVFWRSYALSPYLKAQGGRLLIADGLDDLTALGGGGGLVLFLNRRVGLQLEAVVFRYLPADVCGDDCVDVSVGLTFGIYFGGAGSRVRPAPLAAPPPAPRPAPPAPPPAAPAPAAAPEPAPPDPSSERDEPYPGRR